MLQAFFRVCCEFSSTEQSKYEFCAPLYQILNADALQSIQDKIFPAIVKNNTACAVSKSHVMYAVSRREDVDKLKRFVGRDEDVVAQRFVPHYGIILKVYVLDDHFFISLRPSIEQAAEFISFNSQDLRKDFNPDELFSEKYQQVEALINDLNFKSTLKSFISRVRSEFNGISLFGLDLVICEDSGRLNILDINYFPGYKNISEFPDLFASFLEKRITSPDKYLLNS